MKDMYPMGIMLEILAACIGTASKQLIAYSQYANKQWIFHLGAGMNIFLGPTVDFSAYIFAPAVVIAPFLCLDVILNALVAPYTLSWQAEQIRWTHIVGTLLVATGACFTAIFGSVEGESKNVYELEAQLTQPAALAYYLVELSFIGGIDACRRRELLSTQVRGMALGVCAGILMGNVFCLRGFTGIVENSIRDKDASAWLRPTPYILIGVAAGGAIIGHIFMREGLGSYKGIFMVTIFEGAHITAACLSGCVVMQEMHGAPWWRYTLYWVAVLTIAFGMAIINTSAKEAVLSPRGDKATRGDEAGKAGVKPDKIGEVAMQDVTAPEAAA